MPNRSSGTCRRCMNRCRKRIGDGTRPWKPRNWGTAACSISRLCLPASRTRSGRVGATSSSCRRTRRTDASEKKGGRKASTSHPEVLPAIEAIVADHTAGSPVDEGIRWTNRSSRQISEELQQAGFSLCPDTVRRVLREELGLSVRQARKDEAARQYPHRNEQFEYIAELREWYLRQGWP